MKGSQVTEVIERDTGFNVLTSFTFIHMFSIVYTAVVVIEGSLRGYQGVPR